MIIKFTTVALIAWLCGIVKCLDCSTNSLSKCSQPISEYPIDNSSPIVYLNATVMMEHCRRFRLFNDCYKTIRTYCKDKEQIFFDEISSAYKYMCDDTYQAYLKYQPCLSTPELLEDGRFCKYTFDNNIQVLRNSNYTSYTRDRLCSYANNYIDCIFNAVNSICGNDAANWQQGVDLRMINPTLLSYGCTTKKYYDNTDSDNRPISALSTVGLTPIIIIIAVVLFVLVLIIVSIVTYIVVKIYRRRRQADNHSNEMHRENPADVYNPAVSPGLGNFPYIYDGSESGKADSFSILPPYPGIDAPPPYSNGTIPSRKGDPYAISNITLNDSVAEASPSVASSLPDDTRKSLDHKSMQCILGKQENMLFNRNTNPNQTNMYLPGGNQWTNEISHSRYSLNEHNRYNNVSKENELHNCSSNGKDNCNYAANGNDHNNRFYDDCDRQNHWPNDNKQCRHFPSDNGSQHRQAVNNDPYYYLAEDNMYNSSVPNNSDRFNKFSKDNDRLNQFSNDNNTRLSQFSNDNIRFNQFSRDRFNRLSMSNDNYAFTTNDSSRYNHVSDNNQSYVKK